MSLLRSEPPAPLTSMEELFALAASMEREAVARYAALASEMHAAGQPAVAQAFEDLAAEERHHMDAVAAWSRSHRGTPPDPAHLAWQPPDTFDEAEARAIASSSLASAYRALTMAVRNEERAFALWTYIAAQAGDAAIRRAAERMALEELGHAAQLRRERRRAFHAERNRAAGAGTTPALRRPPAEEAALAEHRLAATLGHLAASPEAPASLRHWSAETKGMAAEARALAPIPLPPAEPVATPALPDAARLAERALEASLEAAAQATEEAAMARWQSLAARAIPRSAALRELAIPGEAPLSSGT